jgi:hypothetical protein
MTRVTSVLLVAGAVLLPIGWIFVLASGYHGDSSSGETIWRIAGLMVYVGGPCLLLAALTHVAHSATARRRGRAAGH